MTGNVIKTGIITSYSSTIINMHLFTAANTNIKAWLWTIWDSCYAYTGLLYTDLCIRYVVQYMYCVICYGKQMFFVAAKGNHIVEMLIFSSFSVAIIYTLHVYTNIYQNILPYIFSRLSHTLSTPKSSASYAHVILKGKVIFGII